MNHTNNVSHLSAYERPRTSGTLHVQRRTPEPQGDGQRKKFVAKGHDSQLQEAQHGKLPVEVVTINESLIKGTISRRDKYTVTLRLSAGTDAGKDLIIYKHAIESILIERAAPVARTEAEPASAEY